CTSLFAVRQKAEANCGPPLVSLCEARYLTVNDSLTSHFVPEVFTAKKASVCAPEANDSEMFAPSVVVEVNFFTPSAHTSKRAKVPVTAPAAATCTGLDTVSPLVGEQTCTPA